MKVALIGASGFVGTAILNELVSRGHQVTAIARDSSKISLKNELVTTASTDVMNESALTQVLSGHDAVISAYNSGWTNPNIYADFIAGSKAIQAAVHAAGVKRLIVVGGAGSLYLPGGIQLIETPEFPEEYKPGASAARDYLNLLKTDRELDWSFLSPAIEMNPATAGVKKGVYRTALENPVFDDNGRSVISVEDLALVIVDELETPKHIKQRFTAAY